MATLTKDTPREYEGGNIEGYPVIASDIIYEGAGVGENGSGYARPLVAGDAFLGFAEEQADNSDGAAGAINVRVKTKGKIRAEISGLAVTDNDRVAIYMSDDNTFTTTSTSNSLIGYLSRYISSGIGIVEFDAALVKAALQA